MKFAKNSTKHSSSRRKWFQGICLALTFSFLFAACSEEEASSSVPVVAEEVDTSLYIEEPEILRDDIDFDELKETNEDVIAWIEVPGTVIDYPVMRGVDNAKYLTTTIDGEYDLYGSVFADMQNPDDLLDRVSVLYGHFTPDDTFFTQLHNYKDAEYFEENPDMFLYTPYRQEQFEVVAAFTTDNRNILYERNYNDPEELEGFIDWLSETTDEEANLNLEGLSTSDRFLVLSTCVAEVGGSDERYIVVSKYVDE